MEFRAPELEPYKGNTRGTIRFTDVVETGLPETRRGSKVPRAKRKAKRRAKRKAKK